MCQCPTSGKSLLKKGKPIASAYEFHVYSWKGASFTDELHCKCCWFTGSSWKVKFCPEGSRTYKNNKTEKLIVLQEQNDLTKFLVVRSETNMVTFDIYSQWQSYTYFQKK